MNIILIRQTINKIQIYYIIETYAKALPIIIDSFVHSVSADIHWKTPALIGTEIE